MKARKTCLYYLLVLVTAIMLSGCSRYNTPVESFQSSETQPVQLPGQEEGGNGEGGQTDKNSGKDAATVQAEFNTFTDRVFREIIGSDPLNLHFMVRHPENYGIETPEIKFQTISKSELEQDTKDNEELLKELEAFDPSLLTSDQLFTYKMLEDSLEIALSSKGLELYSQPLSPLIGTQAQLPVLLAEYTFYDKTDIEHYLELLSQIDAYYGQLAAYEKEMADAGLAPSDITIDRMLQSCKDYLIRPENSFLTETFNSRLDEVEGLTEDEKTAYKTKHLQILKEHFIPAYTTLSKALEELKGRGTNENGLCHYEKGKAYYEYLVATLTGTDSSIPELKNRIEKKFGSDMAETAKLLQNNPALVQEIERTSFSLSEPVEILDHLREQIKTDFPELTDSTYEVKHVPKALESSLSPAFFLIPPIDSDTTNVIYINDKSREEGTDLYSVLAHEGYPGHLYQSVYFNRKQSCPLRHFLSCGGYDEGWGLYCELYSYSFDNGLSPDMKELMARSQASIYALYALLDIHIHYDGWDLEKVSGFLQTYYGISDAEVCEEMFHSIIDNPGNYLKYYTGYLEICTLRDSAKKTLGNRYSPKAFHKFILDMEGASFRVIKPYFETWLLTYDVTN